MATRKIVLTGGAGFLLSYVAETYAAMGDHVVMFDRTKQNDLPDYAKKILEETPRARYVESDIRDKQAVEKALGGADLVYHFAALMGTNSRFKQEVVTTEVNVIGWLTPYIITKTASTRFAQMHHETYGLPSSVSSINSKISALSLRGMTSEMTTISLPSSSPRCEYGLDLMSR